MSGWVILGAGLLLSAILLPAEATARLLTVPAPAERELAVGLLRIGLALDGVALLLRATLLRDAFRGRGVPLEACGLLARSPAATGRERLWLLGVLVVGTAARAVGLDQDLWIDEIATVVNYLRLPPWEAVQSYSSANQHLLYSLLGSVSFRLFGESAWAARLPALLFGLAGLVALHALARLLAPAREALLAAALLAVSYHHVWFSQSARGYTGMIFFATLGTALFLRALVTNRDGAWAAYAAAMALGILCLQNTTFVLVGHVATYPLAFLRWPRWRAEHAPITRRVAWNAGLIALLSLQGHALVLPQMVTFFKTADRTGLGWTRPAEFLQVVGGGLLTGLGALGFAVLAALLGAGLRSYARQSPILAGLLAAPAAFNLAALAGLRYGAYPRSFLYALPFAMLLAARGALALGRTGPLAAAALLLASSAALGFNYRYPKQNYSGALAWVRAHAAEGDVVAAVGLAATSYRYYYGPDLRFPDSPEELRALGAGRGRVWALYTSTRDMRLRFPWLLDLLERDFRPVATFRGTLGDGDVHVARADGSSISYQRQGGGSAQSPAPGQ